MVRARTTRPCIRERRANLDKPALNVPLKRGSGPAEFLRGFQQILDASEAFNPDLILISAGFDAHKDDMFRFLRLNDQCYRDMTKRVMDLAYRVCGGRIVSLLEGGYTIHALVRGCSVVHARALATYGQPGAVAGVTPASRPQPRRPAPQREEEHFSRKRARRAPKRWMPNNLSRPISPRALTWGVPLAAIKLSKRAVLHDGPASR